MKVPYSRKYSRGEIFINFAVCEPSAKVFPLEYFPLYGMGSKKLKGIRYIEGREGGEERM